MNRPELRFVIHGSGLAHYPAGTSFGPRRLGDHELVWILSGRAVWRVEGRDLPAPAGTMLLARPGMCDGFIWDPHRPTRHGYVHFDIAAGVEALPPAQAWPLTRTLPVDDVLRPLLRHLGWLIGRDEAAAAMQVQQTMGLVLTAFLSGLCEAGEAVQPEAHPAVQAALEHARERIEEGDPIPPTLGDLSRAAGVSRMHLTRLFRARFGLPPVEAVRCWRLDRAAGLLAGTMMPVQAVAAATGFADAFNFSRSFRARYGCPPSSYRRRVAAGQRVPVTPLAIMRSLGG